MLAFVRHDWVDGLSVDIWNDQESNKTEVRSYGLIANLSGVKRMIISSSLSSSQEAVSEFKIQLSLWRGSYGNYLKD